ncbi:MAG: DNA gyrase subunit A, partial [Candidatus Aenigmarchaeota archaeon]|nr:DNA gyrase subunit A [Candidatus Aenigmarchaeota archaeon]
MDNKPTEEIDKIVPVKISKEMKESYLAYSMSVIIGRALPDARDGLKPVHRRVLYAMHDMGLSSKKPFKKSARIVGEVLGKYHPHGDSAVYQTMVRMAQPFSMNHLLVSGQGNFGSVDGDNAAAMRYTEARMTALAEELLRDIEKETVNFVPNFDESLEEPSVLPAKSPNLLINGSTGIAVGMATNIPPHNLGEVCEGIIKVIDNPEIELSDLMNIIKAPDFPTGGLICGRDGVAAAYRSGKGKVIVRSKVDVVERDTNRLSIIVNELPYTVNKSNLIKAIADLIKDKKIEGISDLRDESDRDGMRVVIELTKGTNPEIVLNQLY